MEQSLKVEKGAERDENRNTNRDYLNYNIVKIVQNTEESSGDLEDLLSLRLQSKTITFCWCLKNLPEITLISIISQEEPTLSRLQHSKSQLEYFEQSWGSMETFCYSAFNEKPSADAGEKTGKE